MRKDRKRSLAVHYRVAGKSEMYLMIALCRAHNAMVTRTPVLLEDWLELLRVLWREQHPYAHEQTALDFSVLGPPARQTKFFLESGAQSKRAFLATAAFMRTLDRLRKSGIIALETHGCTWGTALAAALSPCNG